MTSSFARPEISRAIDEVADRSFRQIEQEGGVGELPDGATFLDGLEVDPAEAGTHHLGPHGSCWK